jgi:hypothetical protein
MAVASTLPPMTLERRLARLEASSGIGVRLPVIFVSFRRPGSADPPVATATVNGRVWHREPEEPKEAFLGRVAAEARPMRPDCGVVAFLE